MDEIWKTSVSVGTYEISSHGRVRHKQSGEIRKIKPNGTVNMHFTTNNVKNTKTVTISKEILKSFIRPEKGREYAIHKDRDESKEDYNHLGNLEWSKSPPPPNRNKGIKRKKADKIEPGPSAEIVTLFFGERYIEVSSDALVRSDNKNKYWRAGSIHDDNHNYPRVSMQFDRDGKTKYRDNNKVVSTSYDIHFLVALAFLGPNPDTAKYVVDHIDGSNGVNTNNHSYNLQYVTKSQNQARAMELGNQKPPGEKAVVQYTMKGVEVATYKSQSEASRAISGKDSGAARIGEVCNGKYRKYREHTWRRVGDTFERVEKEKTKSTHHGVYIGKLRELVGKKELIMIGDKFLVKIGAGDLKRRAGDTIGMVASNFICDEGREFCKFLVKHEKIIDLASTVKNATDRFYMTGNEFQMAIGLANDSVGSYMNFNEDEEDDV